MDPQGTPQGRAFGMKSITTLWVLLERNELSHCGSALSKSSYVMNASGKGAPHAWLEPKLQVYQTVCALRLSLSPFPGGDHLLECLTAMYPGC